MHFSVTTTPQAGARKWSYFTFSPQALCLGSLRTYNSVPMWIKSQLYTSLIWVNLFYSSCSYMIFLYWIALCILCNCTFIDQWPYYGIIYQTPSYDSKNIFYSAHTWPFTFTRFQVQKSTCFPLVQNSYCCQSLGSLFTPTSVIPIYMVLEITAILKLE